VKRRRVPQRVLHPGRLFVAIALLAAAVVIAIVALGGSAKRGTGTPSNVKAPPGLHFVALKQSAGHDYDPIGGDGEHPEKARFVVDRDPNSAWSTEHYQGGALNKDGVGIYLDAKPGVAARQIEIQTPTPGWSGKVYAGTGGPPGKLPDPGWTELGAIDGAKARTKLRLDTAGKRFRYYLVWIQKLPPGADSADIAEISLFR